jgi:hypothetical protein
MRFAYTRNPHAPELVVPVVVGGMTSPLMLDYSAKIDTGADISVVPAEVRKQMGIKPSIWSTSSGALGQTWRAIPLFFVRIRVAGGEWTDVEVTESPRDYVLLGRDILNQFILTANGPGGWFELERPG